MRRFELVEGTSSKFWQVSVEGSSLRVQFGKIGSNGQIQLKALDSPAAAQAECDRLIREKTKKGYVEAAGNGAAAPATAKPAASPAAAPSPPAPKPAAKSAPSPEPPAVKAPAPTAPNEAAGDLFAPRIVFTKEAEELRARWQRWELREIPALDVAKTTAALREGFATERARWEKSDESKWSAAAIAAREAVRASWLAGKAPATFDPRIEGATAILAGEDATVVQLVASWVARAGLDGALRALVHMWSFRRAYGSSDRDAWMVDAVPEENWDSSVCWGKTYATRALRVAFRQATAGERDKAIETARTLRANAPLPVRVGIDKVVDVTEWVEEDALALVTQKPRTYPHDARSLLNQIRDPELLARFAAAYHTEQLEPFTLIAHAGLGAQKVLEDWIETAGNRDRTIEFSTILSVLETEATAAALASRMDKKGLDAVAKAFFARRPDLGLRALAPLVAAGGKLQTFAAPALKVLAEKDPALARAVAGALDAKSAKAILAVTPGATGEAAAAAPAQADASELPPVLVSPPWRSRVPPPPVVADLTPIATPTRLHLTREEREAARANVIPDQYLRGWKQIPADLKARTAAMDAHLRPKLSVDRYYFVSLLDLMTDDGARQFLRGLALDERRLDAGDFLYLLERFGADLEPALLEAARAHSVAAGDAFVSVESVGVATFYAETMARSRQVRARAIPYFSRFPETSALAIVPLALDKKKQKLGIAALHALVRAKAGNDAMVRASAKRYGAAAEKAIEAALAFDPFALVKPPTLPGFFQPGELPPVLLKRGGALPRESVVCLGELLAMCEPKNAHPLLEDVRAATTPASLAAFGWALFQAWLATGAEPKGDWAFIALGFIGGDAAARSLGPLIRAWPGESAHARAVKGLDVLAQIGTDVALMLLDGIAEKVKFKGLQEKAREKIEEVAAERGLSRDELGDRIAPRLDLDDDGSRTLSFGPRSFRVGFDEHLAPFVLDPSGKRIADLPKPTKSDDKAIADEATLAWKTLKKDAKTVGKAQVQRLERAMCTGRAWTPADFDALLVHHPLVSHLVRRLVWACVTGDEKSETRTLFRVAEDRTLVDADERAFVIPDGARVVLAHRLGMSAAELGAWGTILADYELLQPFPQLQRSVYEMTAAERTAHALTRLADVTVPTSKVLGLEARGWRRGTPQDAGWIWDMWKPIARELCAVLPLDGGLLVGAMAESPPEQTLKAVTLSKDNWGGEPFALGVLTPLQFTELVRDLEELRP